MKRTAKTYDYIVVLKEHSSYKYIDWISKLMLLIAIISFLFEVYTQYTVSHQFSLAGKSGLLFILSIIIIFWWLFSYWQSLKSHVPFYRFALLIGAWGWYIHPKGTLFFFFYIIAAILEKPVKILPEIAFDSTEIVFNSFPKKRFLWEELNNVILKDGLLTIDCKNNVLIQRMVNEEIPISVEKEFNEFCKNNLIAKQ